MSVRSAVRTASKASCLVLRKPTNCDFLGSHMKVILALGYLSSILPKSFEECDGLRLVFVW